MVSCAYNKGHNSLAFVCHSYMLDQYFIMEFLANLFSRHFLVLSNEDWAGYSCWRNFLHGCYRCLFVGLDLKVKLFVCGYLMIAST